MTALTVNRMNNKKSNVPSREDLFHPIELLFDSFYEDFFSTPLLSNIKQAKKQFPPCDVYTNDENWVVEMAVSGMDSQDINVEIIPAESGQRTLRITGRISDDYRNDSCSYQIRELRRSAFERLINLPSEVEGDPEAVLSQGILTLKWPIMKKKDVSPIKKISITQK